MREEVLILTNEETKRCARCGKDLNILRFYTSTRSKDCLQSWCISCQKDYRKTREAERKINQLGFAKVALEDVVKKSAALTSKQRTDLRNSLKYIAKKIK